jgi:putative oxidoreductase
MTETTAARAATSPGKALDIVLWVLQVLVALAFLGAASGKLLGKPEMVGLFEAIGIGQWFRYVTGLLELTGAVLVVIPKTRSAGAVLLATVMVGATATHLFVLHNAPTAPLVLLALTAFIAWGRRGELAALLRR